MSNKTQRRARHKPEKGAFFCPLLQTLREDESHSCLFPEQGGQELGSTRGGLGLLSPWMLVSEVRGIADLYLFFIYLKIILILIYF